MWQKAIFYTENRGRKSAILILTLLDYKEIVDSYVKVTDWRVKENSTVTYSVGGLILSNSGAITANYWLSEIYDERSGKLTKMRISTFMTCPCLPDTAQAGL